METVPSIISDTENNFIKPIACLSDVDDISDIECENVAEELHKTIASKPEYNSRRSIFNTTLDPVESTSACNTTSVSIDAYVKSVEQEQLSWRTFVTQYASMRTASHDDEYRPSEKQQAFLNQRPDLQNFIRGFGAFMDDGCMFMQEFEKMQELQEDLKDNLQFHLNKVQRNILTKALARSE